MWANKQNFSTSPTPFPNSITVSLGSLTWNSYVILSLLIGHVSLNSFRKVKEKELEWWIIGERDFHFPFQYRHYCFPFLWVIFLKIIFLLNRTICLHRSCTENHLIEVVWRVCHVISSCGFHLGFMMWRVIVSIY